MQEELQRVLMLQRSWSRSRSPEMDERGLLIRDAIPVALARHRRAIATALGVPSEELLIEGRDGTGLKTRVPWVRFGSRSMSRRATDGFYVVYLFDTRGDAVFLSLNQGTTDFEAGDFRPKPPRILRARAEWARSVLDGWRPPRLQLAPLGLHDRAGGLGGGYELGDVASVRYSDGAVPGDGALLEDVLAFASALQAIYAAQRETPLPFASPELEAAVEATAATAGKRTPARGAGFRTDAREIRVVERHAVELATAHYAALGWSVRDVGDTKPYDLDLRRGTARLHVEVKGTTSDGMLVTLTDGEVRHHAQTFPHNALVIVSRIALDRSGPTPRAAHGELREIRPWRIDPSHLRPIAHRYAVPASDDRLDVG